MLRIAVLCFGSLCSGSLCCARQRWAALGFAFTLTGRYWAGSGVPCWLVGRRRADFPRPGARQSCSDPTSPPTVPAAPLGPPAGRKRRQSAAKRRARDLRSGRDATPSSRLIGRVRSHLKESAAQLAVEKQRNSDLVGEHFKLSQELRRVADQADLDRRTAAAELARTKSASALEYAASLRRLEALHKVELESTKAKASTARELAWLELERLNALNKRLRSERDQARADSLRFNEERNALRREVAELRARRSEAAVRDVTRTRLSFPGTRAE